MRKDHKKGVPRNGMFHDESDWWKKLGTRGPVSGINNCPALLGFT